MDAPLDPDDIEMSYVRRSTDLSNTTVASNNGHISTEDEKIVVHSTAEASQLLPKVDFGSIKLLAPFLPEAAPASGSRSCARFWARLDVLLFIASGTSFIVLVANLVFTLVLWLKFEGSNIYHGNCTTAGRIDTGLHLLINGLSTLLLGASSMCMQFLASPTRTVIDIAHSQRQWVDTGIPSFHNLRFVPKRCVVLWFMLAWTSAPLHFT